MGIRLVLFFCLAGLLFRMEVLAQTTAPTVQTEEEESAGLIETKIAETLASAQFRLGAFRIQPRLSLFGTYDSNSLLLADNEEDDFSFQASPGVLAILPFRSRALLEVYDDVNFLYYRDLEELRGVFNTVGARFTIGGRRVLFTVGDTFSIRRTGPTQEFDFPTDQRNNNFDSFVTLGLGQKSEARFGVIRASSVITEAIVNPTGIPLSQFFDQKSLRVVGGMRRYISTYTAFVADVYYENWDFAQESLQPDADIYVLQGGFTFQAKGNITGDLILGYKRMTPDLVDEADYSGLIGRGSINVRAGERTTLGLEYTRDARPSVTDGNWFFLENRIAPSVEFFITRRLSVYGLAGYEKNSYERPGLIVTPSGEIVPGVVDDSAVIATFAVRFKIGNIWQLFGSANTLSRTSNAPNSEKKRNVIAGGIQTGF